MGVAGVVAAGMSTRFVNAPEVVHDEHPMRKGSVCSYGNDGLPWVSPYDFDKRFTTIDETVPWPIERWPLGPNEVDYLGDWEGVE